MINIACKINCAKGSLHAYSIKDALICILLMVDTQYSPIGITKRNILKACSIVQELCGLVSQRVDGPAKAQMTRLIRRLDHSKEYIKKAKGRAQLQKRYYELILSMEGLGTLPGFGFSNTWGDRLKGNSEKVSIYKI